MTTHSNHSRLQIGASFPESVGRVRGDGIGMQRPTSLRPGTDAVRTESMRRGATEAPYSFISSSAIWTALRAAPFNS